MAPLARIELFLILGAGLAWASVQDLRTRRISNVLNGVMAAAGLVAWILVAGPDGLLHSGAGLVAGLALGVSFYAMRWLGAGDAKLFAAVGAWAGIRALPSILLWTAATGGVVALAVLAYAKAKKVSLSGPPSERPRFAQVPYGVAIAVGTMIAVAILRRSSLPA